jgi:hypothetical protein
MAQAAAAAAAQTSSASYTLEENTLDEPVWRTIWRDVTAIGRNLRSVLIPINWKFANRDQALRNWDLWGPLVRWTAGGAVYGKVVRCACAEGVC